MKIWTTAQMREAERLSDEMGVTSQRLMENAGCAAAAFIRKTVQTAAGRNFMIFCGGGNNGGDGFVVARKLFEEGAKVIVVLCGGVPKSEEASYMYTCVLAAGITLLDFLDDRQKIEQYLSNAEIIVDALFGTGFSGEFRGAFSEVTKLINEVNALRFSLDVPSGVDAENGLAAKESVIADYTIAFDALKPGHLLLPGKEYCGKTVVCDIGIPHEVQAKMRQSCFAVEENMVFSSFRKRPRYCNKGNFGKLLCITGSRRYPGAALLSTYSALRSGAGLVTVATVEKTVDRIVSRIPEATFLTLPENEDGTAALESTELLATPVQKSEAILLGCGLGRSEELTDLIRFVFENAGGTVILDADGINGIVSEPEILLSAKKTPILTPHIGEMARLCRKTVEEVLENRVELAVETAKKYRAVVALKDATTIVASPNGDVYFNSTGNPGLAKGGSGDCLAGLIASLAAQGFIETAAAVCGVYLHGLAADRAVKDHSEYGLLPTDLPDIWGAILAEKKL